ASGARRAAGEASVTSWDTLGWRSLGTAGAARGVSGAGSRVSGPAGIPSRRSVARRGTLRRWPAPGAARKGGSGVTRSARAAAPAGGAAGSGRVAGASLASDEVGSALFVDVGASAALDAPA